MAQFARRVLEPNSVAVSFYHSGSLRYYGGVMTLNYSHLDERWLDRAVEWLQSRGVRTYAVMEEFEVPDFRRRFAGAERLAVLERPPLGVYEKPDKVLIFDLSGRRPSTAEPLVLRSNGASSVVALPTAPPQLVFGPAR